MGRANMTSSHPNSFSQYKTALLTLVISTLLLACNKDFSRAPDDNDRASRQVLPPTEILDDSGEVIPKKLLDWNQTNDESLCSELLLHNNTLTIGTKFSAHDQSFNRQALDQLIESLAEQFGDQLRVLQRNEKLSLINARIRSCNILSELRKSDLTQFVEPSYFEITLPEYTDAIKASDAMTSVQDNHQFDQSYNPGNYSPNGSGESYLDYTKKGYPAVANIMQRHNLNIIYEDEAQFGDQTIGVAVVDNGVFEKDKDFFLSGGGKFSREGYFKPSTANSTEPDGVSPKRYDLLGVIQFLDGNFDHGTRQSRIVYTLAPNITLKAVRASSFVALLNPSQIRGVIDAIMALADDPEIRIISFSMGTIIYHHEMVRAIEYFTAKDKIFVAAAGTTVPILKDFVKIVFPANLASTISTTGIMDTTLTEGEFRLGETAHGGPENDFVVEYTRASSESVSATAGMIALLWSANPALKRDEIIKIMIESSNFYQQSGKKDPTFGWGKVDLYLAYQQVLSTR